MKKLSFLSFAAALFFLTSCETTREITIGDDGAGTMVTTMDLSQLVSIAKMSGQAKDLETDRSVDTTMSFAMIADSLKDISSEDKELLKKGTFGMEMNMEDEKFKTKFSFPFADFAQLSKLESVSAKTMQQGMKEQMGQSGGQELPADAMPSGSLDDYFTTSYSNGVIEKKLNKEKYATVADDQSLQSLKEVGEQGLPVTSKLVLNLPRAAKKVEGANAKLSEDKKTVTIETSLEDFFDDATKLEFRVEY